MAMRMVLAVGVCFLCEICGVHMTHMMITLQMTMTEGMIEAVDID
jgi:hypothetical protein